MKLNIRHHHHTENDVCFLSLDDQGWPSAWSWDLRMTQIRAGLRQWKNRLGGSRTGRLVLHTLCMVQHPDRAAWHWQGMVREFAH